MPDKQEFHKGSIGKGGLAALSWYDLDLKASLLYYSLPDKISPILNEPYLQK